MDQVGGAVVAIAIVLSAVVYSDSVYQWHYRAVLSSVPLTIAVSTLISAFNSLTLSPALAGLLLQPAGRKERLFDPSHRSRHRLVFPSL